MQRGLCVRDLCPWEERKVSYWSPRPRKAPSPSSTFLPHIWANKGGGEGGEGSSVELRAVCTVLGGSDAEGLARMAELDWNSGPLLSACLSEGPLWAWFPEGTPGTSTRLGVQAPEASGWVRGE